jgi:hypothetical protein
VFSAARTFRNAVCYTYDLSALWSPLAFELSTKRYTLDRQDQDGDVVQGNVITPAFWSGIIETNSRTLSPPTARSWVIPTARARKYIGVNP